MQSANTGNYTSNTLFLEIATVAVTAQDGTTTKTYKLSFFIGAPNVNAPTPPGQVML